LNRNESENNFVCLKQKNREGNPIIDENVRNIGISYIRHLAAFSYAFRSQPIN